MDTKSYVDRVKEYCDNLIKDFEESKKEKAVLTCRQFIEYLYRLHNRYKELLYIEDFILNVNSEIMQKHQVSLHDLQLQFVDKTEAFHQQVYATISSFILLLSHVANDKFKSQMPIESASRFLRHISEKSYDSVTKDQASLLDKSVDFRSKFVDHPQQHILHDWVTYTYPEVGVVIIYFIKLGNEVYHRELINPYHPSFTPPVNYKSYYVSPPHKQVFDAVLHFTDRVLKLL